MEGIRLSDQEKSVYSDIFNACDVETSGKIVGSKALELFLSTGLSHDCINQITELSGAKRLGHFGRSQFFIALKLISMAQNGLPLSLDGHQGVDTLPRFGMQTDVIENRPRHSMERHSEGVILPPPSITNKRSSVEQHISMQLQNNGMAPDRDDPRRPVNAPQTAPFKSLHRHSVPHNGAHYGRLDPAERPHAPGAKVPDNGWAHFEEDSTGLLTNERSRDWSGGQHEPAARPFDTSSVSSETESVDDVWSITDEQREYYVNQFRQMQPNLKGIISGSVAKEFFEKSKLPIQQLSKIWQLSDVNKDGALNLDEFCTAMHLVVLRRNDVELPDRLPPQLYPAYVNYAPLSDEPFHLDLPPGEAQQAALQVRQNTGDSAGDEDSQDASVASFMATGSPTTSNVTSPGSARQAPVSFDFQPVSADKELVHPVALRLSPEIQGDQRGTANVQTNQFADNFQYSKSGIERPQLLSASGDPSERPCHLPVGGSVDQAAPPPPPRQNRTHSRSSSLDANRVLLETVSKGGLAPPPAVPPRPSPKDTPEDGATAAIPTAADICEHRSASQEELEKNPSVDARRVLLSHVRRQREENISCSRLNEELNQELQEVMEQRIALEIQLEHLRPFSG